MEMTVVKTTPIAEPGLFTPDSRDASWVVSARKGAAPDFVDLRSPPQADSWNDLPAPRFPGCDDTFLGFRLVAELGRGAFGRVYLARQDDLAQRLVALKVSTEIHNEAQNLAQLQHTHIVPVYSVHRAGALHAVCMPYFGSATLADVLRDLSQRQVPPASGKGLVSTIENRVSRTRASLDRESAQAASSVSPSALVSPVRVVGSGEAVDTGPRLAEILPTLRMLEGLSHVDAVLWIGQRLAEALAHAHACGILHGDLKPANILLTDDGQPMLLDFNLSTDLKTDASRAQVGGTLPYMAPEHLASFAKAPAPFPVDGLALARADARSDVYSLGVILYELLTGRPLFQQLPGKIQALLPDMIRDRLGPPPRVRPFNRSVSPAVESILRHCLEPDPGQRYQSARELAEDLQRQYTNRPLAHARETSLRERTAKCLRRNKRRAIVTASLGALAIIACLLAGLASHGRRLDRMEAAATLTAFHEQRDEAHLLLAARPEDEDQRSEGLAIAHQALARYGVLEGSAWTEQPAVLHLPSHEQQHLAMRVGELLLLTASTDAVDRRETLIRLAGDCFPPDEAPRAFYMQSADQAERQGDPVAARTWRDKAKRRQLHQVMDLYLLARERADAGRIVEAIKLLREVVRLDPKHFAAWYLLGNCYLDARATSPRPETEAIRCYTVCMVLRPTFYGCCYNRGLARLRQNNHVEAEADFTAALELRPALSVGHLHRGLAREGQGKFREALADLTKAMEAVNPSSLAFFGRARVRRELGDPKGSKRDELEGFKHTPPDAESFVFRGTLHLPANPRAALADFREAVRLDRHSLPGLYNQAQILADRMGQTEEAIRLLDQVIRLYPHLAKARASRGILRARLGRRETAHQDGREAFQMDGGNAKILYRVACIHALTSATHPDDSETAFRLLFRTLRLGFGDGLLQSDPDLKPLRGDTRFLELLEAAEVIRKSNARMDLPIHDLR